MCTVQENMLLLQLLSFCQAMKTVNKCYLTLVKKWETNVEKDRNRETLTHKRRLGDI